jgi:hypothetical protein
MIVPFPRASLNVPAVVFNIENGLEEGKLFGNAASEFSQNVNFKSWKKAEYLLLKHSYLSALTVKNL